MINNSKLILSNANYYCDNSIKKGTIIIEAGKIKEISGGFDPFLLTEGYDCIDCSRYFIVPGFIDSHLHLPGDLLYRNYGLYLGDSYSIGEYLDTIRSFPENEMHVIRGYGWNHEVMNEEQERKGYTEIKKILDERFTDKPVILYSDDFHSCICNQYLIDQYKPVGVYEYPLAETGLFEEADIFELQRQRKELSFSDAEIMDAILAYQDMLLENGVTSVQTLMFLGGDNLMEWELLHKLDEDQRLLININLSLTVHPGYSHENMVSMFNRLKEFSSDKIRVNTIKIYIDGVVENQTAFLLKPYENSESTGSGLWNREELNVLCSFADSNHIQIHSHAIGDAAVHQITDALCCAMDHNGTKKASRHVITHLQLADDRDIRKMGEYGIIACLQPYWIPVDQIYPLDVRAIGERAKNEYKVQSFLKHGVRITASSDSPVTPRPYPVLGMYQAIFRENLAERVSLPDILNAFTENGAWQLGREKELGVIKEGYHADLTILSNQLYCNSRKEFETTEVVMTITDGFIRFDKNK